MIKESTQEDIVTIIYMYALNTGGLQYIVNTCIVKVAQSCPTLCDPMDYTVHGILQARILEWVAFPFSRDLPNPGIEPRSPTLQADSLPSEPLGKPQFPLTILNSLPFCFYATRATCAQKLPLRNYYY